MKNAIIDNLSYAHDARHRPAGDRELGVAAVEAGRTQDQIQAADTTTARPARSECRGTGCTRCSARRGRQPRLSAGALSGHRHRRTTGTWRSPTACATACWRAGSSTVQTYAARDVKVACYLSAEFLIGPQLGNNLVNLGIEASAREAMRALGQDLDALLALEEEPGLGNGGLGRLAACYLDSLATLEMPAIGYGIRYEFGIFDQEIRDGWQVEVTDKWLQKGNPWEIVRPDVSFYVKFGGHTEAEHRCAGPLSRALDAGAQGQGRGLRHAGARLSRQHLQHAAAVEERGGRIVRLRRTSTSATTTAPCTRR